MFEARVFDRSVDRLDTERLPKKERKKKKREKTAQNCSVMHEKKRAKNDDAFMCSREVL